MAIDWWTLAFQTANVLILVWLLSRVLYRPVVKVIAGRQAEAERLLDDAAAAKAAAEQSQNALAEARGAIDAERRKMLDEARTGAERERAALLATVDAEAAKHRADARASMERERREAESRLLATASTLAVDIARRLVSRLPADRVIEGFLGGLQDAAAGLPETLVESLRQSARGGDPVQIVTATSLTDPERKQVTDAVRALLGAPDAALRFAVDPALLGGFEIVSPNAAIRNSWRADLERITSELAHADSG